MSFEALGYHSCRAEGSKEELLQKVPFLSKPNNQWLGQGYYFWTDSDYWAKNWRNKKGEIVISEFKISLNKSDLLDLVGNINDQYLFQGILKAFSKRYGSQITVSSVLSLLLEDRRKPDSEWMFRYWAIKAKDTPRSLEGTPFVPPKKSEEQPRGYEELLLLERHQMCVYSEYKDRVVNFERFVYPAHFMDGTTSSGVIA